jgi:hypothetical protein
MGYKAHCDQCGKVSDVHYEPYNDRWKIPIGWFYRLDFFKDRPHYKLWCGEKCVKKYMKEKIYEK